MNKGQEAQVILPVSYPTLEATQGNQDPSLAYGLSGISDWHPGLPFINVMKMTREWLGFLPGQWGGISYSELVSGGYLDENGWPKRIPAHAESIGAIFAWGGNDYNEGQTRAGRYVLTYEGEGDLRLMLIGASAIVSQAPGKIVFNISTDEGNWGYKIYKTDPNNTGNYIRNVAIVKEEYLDLHEAGAIFNPEWLALLKDTRQIRFMDWMKTNGSNQHTWAETTKFNNYSWSVGNVPVEVQVRLANEIGADPWFNIPFHADDAYVRAFAEYVKDNLDPALVAHVELSNEVWNWAFQQTKDAQQLAETRWSTTAGDAWLSYYGMRASQVMKIWTDVFGSATDTRLRRVAGTQTVNAWLSEQIVTAPLWKTKELAAYVAPYTYFDVLSPTTYFGGGAVTDADRRTALLNAINDTSIDEMDFHYKLIKGEIPGFSNEFDTFLVDSMSNQKVVADKYGLDLMAYEGGQHVHHSAFVSIPEADLLALQNHLIAFVRSPQMATLYNETWERWKIYGKGPFMQFGEVGTPSKWGSWGLRASNSDNPPRALAVDIQNQQTPAWWENRGGSHFAQGRILQGTATGETIAGTIAEDYLSGRDGNDTIYPGIGDDGVNGGSGTDKVLFKGQKNQYTVVAKGKGFMVTGPDGKDFVYAVEELVFEDGSTVLGSTGGSAGTDTDSDGIADTVDNCPTVANPGQANFDNDTQGDACDSDDDNDGIADTAEKTGCILNPSTTCGATTIIDTDKDGIADTTDNCPTVANPSQADADADGQGDACDTSSGNGATISINSRVKTTDRVRVRNVAGTESKSLGTRQVGDPGTVVSGPVSVGQYVWWNVNFDSGKDGWVASDYLTKI